MRETLKKFIDLDLMLSIYILGFIDFDDKTLEFYPDMSVLYMQVGKKYMVLESDFETTKIKIEILKFIDINKKYDEMTPVLSSLDEIILIDTLADNRIKNIILYNFSENLSSNSFIICDAIEIELKSGQHIFLDPSFHTGIGIGGLEQKKYWESNNSNIISVLRI